MSKVDLREMIALYAASLAKLQEKRQTIQIRTIPEERKVVSKPVKPAQTPPPMPTKVATLEDAKTFIHECNLANKEKSEAETKKAIIRAIEKFTGAYTGELYSLQLDRARQRARYLIQQERYGKSPAPTAQATLQGYVKGMPNPRQREIDNLIAQRRVAVEALLHAHNQDDPGAEAWEQERINNIDERLAALGV
ncbi:MAG: hypothetical protein EBT07_09075 [Actinobacteria bacterium]|nr:hypothetical protein [Actinomycetota bacterium]